MHDLLTHPAVLAGLLPFIAALLTAELLQRLRLSGLAVVAGFASTVYFIADFSSEPLTDTRKIIWLGILASAVAIPLTLLVWSHWRPILTALAAAIAVWVSWHSLQQQPIANALLWGAACALYAGWLVFWFDGLRDKPVAAGSAGLALGLGSGLAALLCGTVIVGEFSLALGAAAAAYLVIQLITNSPISCGRTFTLPLSLIAAMAGILAAIGGRLPWHVLPVLGLIPLAAHIPIPEKWTLRLRTLALSAMTLSCAAAAVYLKDVALP